MQANGKDPFVITKYNQTHHSQEIKDHFEELEGNRGLHRRTYDVQTCAWERHLSVTYRIWMETFSAYVARDSIGEDAYKDFKKLDVGDLIGITGEVFKTKTGEISIHAAEP